MKVVQTPQTTEAMKSIIVGVDHHTLVAMTPNITFQSRILRPHPTRETTIDIILGQGISNRNKRKREHSPDILSISDNPSAPLKGQKAEGPGSNIPDSTKRAYEHLLPHPDTSTKFLYSAAFSVALRVTASQVAPQFRAFTSDEKATKISPTPLTDQVRHAAILDAQFYTDLRQALGVTINHRPEGASDEEAEHRAKRLVAMEGIYKAFFLANPLGRRPATPPASPPQVIQASPAADQRFSLRLAFQDENSVNMAVKPSMETTPS
ncbi:hypothetical protein ACEPPN_003813 [Leptodophora sp. 'Broadleaf-Isolate-01']